MTKNTYQEDHLIIWQKWFDPFGEDDTGDMAEDQQLLEDDTEDAPYSTMDALKKPMRAIATPMGIIPYTENTASGKIFNFWVGHTNFSITSPIADLIEDVDGVESLDIFTRYRFRIAIGKVFDGAIVMKEINDQIYQHLDNTNGN